MVRFSTSLLLTSLFFTSACALEYTVEHESSGSARQAANPYAADAGSGDAAARCAASIDRWKELLVIDKNVLQSPEAKNEIAGAAFSFRSQMEALAGAEHASAFTSAWLASWSTVTSVGAAPVSPRPEITRALLAPWRDAGYDTAPSMARAPFRLIAIVNRLDLRDDPNGCGREAGELRLVYTATEPRDGSALALTVIVELPYPRTRSARGWAEAWHALAGESGPTYVRGLAALVREVTRHASQEERPVRIRTNEALGDAAWELRQFELDPSAMALGSRKLVGTALVSTPKDDLSGSPALRTWVVENDVALEAGTMPDLPLAMRAGASTVPFSSFRWIGFPVSEAARHTFSASTCNGCHGGERPSGDPLRFQHLAPWDAPGAYYGAPGTTTTQVSTYLHDPSGREDELGRRATSMETLLCTADCPTPRPTPSADAGAPSYGHAMTCR